MSAPEFQVVISFRQTSEHADAADWREWWEWRVRHIAEPAQKVTVADLTVAVREIGAQGESSTDEGRWDAPPSHQDGPGTPQGAGS